MQGQGIKAICDKQSPFPFLLQKRHINCNLTLAFGERPAPLGWSEVVPLFFISEQRGTTGTRKRVCPYDVVILTSPIQEKKHWDGDLADLTSQCVKVGHELFELFDRQGQGRTQYEGLC